MIRFYSPVFLLQLFCFYHVYTNSRENKWYLIILFFPFFGSIFYLYKTFYHRIDVDTLTEEVKNTLISNRKIDKLEKELNYSDTVANRILLADEHLLVKNYSRASELYESCHNGIYKDDEELLLKMLKASYHNDEFGAAIKYGEKISENNLLKNSEDRIFLAWSYYERYRYDEAERVFKEMDARFTNYTQRLDYAKFLDYTDRTNESQQKLQILLDEIDSMNNYEKRLKKNIYRQIKSLYQQK